MIYPLAEVTDYAAKIPQGEKNIGSPLILVSLTLMISSPISGRHQSSPILSLSGWQVISGIHVDVSALTASTYSLSRRPYWEWTR